jgi:hypothetical protein
VGCDAIWSWCAQMRCGSPQLAAEICSTVQPTAPASVPAAAAWRLLASQLPVVHNTDYELNCTRRLANDFEMNIVKSIQLSISWW